MNRNTVVLSALAISLLLANPAFADGPERGNTRGHGDQGQGRNPGRDQPHNRGHDAQRQPAHEAQRGYEQRHGGPGAGPNHSFYRGERLPNEYRHRNYVINDWRDHRLHAPPRGYHWVQTGPDYLLVAIASGIITEVLLHH
ncbi:RcnB family protein [Rhodocyclus tenuis]|uniref:Ni/Co efflux regulator RcnB n=1 Tax=Rhodocyclus tenuis TaxID=1066 RepID=A0A840GB63_RHOTE|nr:RcnB family protein [Rhodocyclus tenuis]MBB4247908.1 Ni/Co efflux regulator RcnB [Rhodocyclus tenuis]